MCYLCFRKQYHPLKICYSMFKEGGRFWEIFGQFYNFITRCHLMEMLIPPQISYLKAIVLSFLSPAISLMRHFAFLPSFHLYKMCGWGMGGSSFLSSDCLLALSCAPYALKKPCSEKVKHKIGIPCAAVHVLQ